MKALLKAILRRFGYDVVRTCPRKEVRIADLLPDFTDAEQRRIERVRPFSMTSAERLGALVNAVTYISKSRIPGDIAECGVWRGGSMMATALTLMELGDTSRNLYLYDTYEGMPPPTTKDVSLNGVSAEQQLSEEPKGTGVWCEASLEDVQANLRSTGYPADKIHFVKGKVEDTIPNVLPSALALLRLDTDWYESTLHELKHLFPLLHPRGILIIDDYGHWQGARMAVDEYFASIDRSVYLHRIDYTGRILVGSG